MLNLKKLMNGLAQKRAEWGDLMQGARWADATVSGAAATRLAESHGFGSNPGNLRMFTYLPPSLAASPALVVVLHGCTQTAAGYDLGAGWSSLADRYGFALLLPEQQRSNNPNGCFNWFQSGDIRRGRGEALSIRQMVEKVVLDQGINRRRVFVTGLSAGGAMTSVMLACYPDVFAAGAIIAGLPYGAAANVQQAFASMAAQSPARSAREWGDLVRGAAPYDGPWPRISVWQGDADRTVDPSNAREIVKQWTDVHGLPITPSAQSMVDGYPRQVWINAAGDALIESYTITQMAHGTPLAAGEADGECGVAGPFLLDVGISSSYHIARFFGLTGADRSHIATTRSDVVAVAPERRHIASPEAAFARPDQPAGGTAGQQRDARPQHAQTPPSAGIDIGAVINKALKAAGLMKGR